jgi:RNA polymerase sigma factor (sigma-70 family)
MSPSPSDDAGTEAERLFSAFKAGYVALSELLARYREYLIAIVREEMPDELKGRVSASDIVHDAYVSVFNRLETEAAGVLSVRGEENLRLWLRRFVRYTLSNRIRDEFRDKRDVRREQPGAAQGLNLPSRGSSITSLVRRSERDERLDRAIENLPESDRLLIRLRYWYDVGFADLGVLLFGEADGASRKAEQKVAEIIATMARDELMGELGEE